MAKSNYIVPKSEQHAYKMLVQRANRRVKANLKYITKNKITNEHTQRSLVGSFNDPEKWASGRMPFSRSTKGRYLWNADTGQKEFVEFKNKAEFDAYVRQLTKWGKEGRTFDASPKRIKEDYKTSIIRALDEVKTHYNISLPNGEIPKEIYKALDSMTLEQITNFYANGDPSEDMEISQFSSDDFLDVETAQDFIDVVTSRINQIKRFH